jgi:hypothetical protein
MTYSYTQISQYLRCPRQYRYRYLDGWREKEDKASLMFGRCFENALSGYFGGEDSTAKFFQEWRKYQDASLAYAKNDSWDRLYHRAFTCSNGSLRMIGCEYNVQKRICR